jgi:hypothetical protein
MTSNTAETVDHASRAHAEFGPSSLKHVAKCAGYHGKDGTSAASEKGTRIHEALEVRDPSALHDEEEVAIYEAALAEEIELFEHIYGGEEGVTILREYRLHLKLAAHTPTFGTSDIVAYKGSVGLLIDYKTGISKIDPPKTNWQAKAYALGMFQEFPELEEIVFGFIVPVREEVLVGKFHRIDMKLLEDEISAVIREAEKVRPKWDSGAPDLDDLNPSVDCRFCRHEDHCPALGAVALDIVKRTKPELLPDGPIDLQDIENPETLDTLYIVAKIVESWAGGIKQRAVRLANDGVEFPNLRLKSMGSLKKTEDTNRLAELAMHHGLTLHEVISAANLSVTQLSKVIYDKSSRGKKSNAVGSFESEALETGIVSVGPVRYTLTDR